MKFLLDQDVYAVTEQHLQTLGHDVVTARALGLSQADDTDLLEKAAQEQRIFVSRDRDFGDIVFANGLHEARLQPHGERRLFGKGDGGLREGVNLAIMRHGHQLAIQQSAVGRSAARSKRIGR